MFVDCTKRYTEHCFEESKRKVFNKAVENSIELVHQMCTSPQYQAGNFWTNNNLNFRQLLRRFLENRNLAPLLVVIYVVFLIKSRLISQNTWNTRRVYAPRCSKILDVESITDRWPVSFRTRLVGPVFAGTWDLYYTRVLNEIDFSSNSTRLTSKIKTTTNVKLILFGIWRSVLK